MKQNQLLEVVQKFYTIGIDLQNEKHDGKFKCNEERYSLIERKFDRQKGYKTWQRLLQHIKTESGLQIVDNTIYGTPCYSAKLSVNIEKINGTEFRQDLFLNITLLGSFFTIYGLDQIIYNIEDEDRYIFQPIACVSPKGIYATSFEITRSQVSLLYQSHTFASLLELSPRVKGLYFDDALVTDGAFPSIFQALFLPDDITDYKKRGDFSYS